MKCAVLACVLATANAAKPSFALGQELGDAISAGISGDSAGFANRIAPALEVPVLRNAGVEGALAAAAKKASFLQRPALNLHVGETSSSGLAADRAAAAAALMSLEQSEVDLLDRIAHKSFLQSPVSDLQREGAEGSAFVNQITYYGGLVDAGGVSARRGLIGLLQLASLPNARVALQPMLFKVSNLAKKESTPDSTRELAGSLITFLSNLPYSVQSSDVATGAYGHTNIVLPSPSRVYGADRVLAQLSAGAHAADTSAGSLN
mmetsp:Transcript_26208/g.65986  ORF Transcript_26208/g.65986 Transcript_26208/m.65986 type:complete len:263 (-) Transcript_26208:166-954(-)